MAKAQDALNAAPAIDELNLSMAMFIVETEKQLLSLLCWSNLNQFPTVKFNCYFVVNGGNLLEKIMENQISLNKMNNLEITGPADIPEKVFLNIKAVLNQVKTLRVLGHSNDC
jgi:hypothetical protein